MLFFRIRDYASVLFYRLIGKPLFKHLGKGVRIVFPLRIVGSKYITLGDNITLQYGAYVAVIKNDKTPLLEIQSGTLIGNYVHLICTQKIIIEEKVLISDKVYISDNLHKYQNTSIAILDQPLAQLNEIVIGSGSWIGENVCIIGASIGKNCVIGANSVVTKDIPDFTVAVGSPAKSIKRYCFDTTSWKKTDSDGNFIH
jgi:carbonic anhydrase/acetyltransferase-like protein (isoleucine patch superfamily)